MKKSFVKLFIRGEGLIPESSLREITSGRIFPVLNLRPIPYKNNIPFRAGLLIIFVLLSVNCVFAGGSSQKTASQSQTQNQTQTASQTYELAFITAIGSIDDGSFNQGSWEGLVRYAAERNITYKHYQPAGQSIGEYLSAIDDAVKSGAKVIVTPGYLFDVPVFRAQDIYPNVRFIIIDSIPNNGGTSGEKPVYKTGNNTVGVLYAEDQAGFLAGYAVVKDGYRNLGFLGGAVSSSVIRFGYGFIQGAEYAAQELGLASGSVTINYHYTGDFIASPAVQALALLWYNSGIEVIFACGGAVGSSVMAAAEQTGRKVVGVDIDQSGESQTVITSAMKMLQISVYDCILSYYTGTFPGGETLVYHAGNNGIGLPMASSRFRTFSTADYENIMQRLSRGIIPRIEGISANGSPAGVSVSIVRISEL